MADRMLKLYVESTSLPLVHQMADFVACARDPEVHKIITWLRLPLTAAQLDSCQAVYQQQLAAVSPDFVAMVRERVRHEGFSRVEIHSNHYHAWRGVAPLLRALAPLLRPEQIQLHLYDDGLVGPVQREQHRQLTDWVTRLRAAAPQLHAHIHDGAPIAWTPEQNHAWHLCWPTRYHWLRPDVLLQTPQGQDWFEPLADHVQPMVFDGVPDLTASQSEHFLQLFGLVGATADRVAAVTRRPDTILFSATGTWDMAWQQRMVQSQLLGIATLRRHGCFDGVGAIAFKPHPANLAHDHLLIDALRADDGPEVLTLPPRVPLEVLLMAGLLPRTLIGVLGTFLATVPPAMVGMILCRQDAFRGGSDAPHIEFLVRAGQLQEQQLLPMLTHD